MKEQIGSSANGKSAAPELVSSGSRAVVAVAVVCASMAAVWLADMVSSTLPPEMAQATAWPEPRLARALPTVTVVGRRASLDDAPIPASQEVATGSGTTSDDMLPGRVKFRQ